ncbi:dihydrofolate reductase [Thalassospiraceae bacterium LMO-JJ14]|nr:dihydrofolate reductase [Thalassospiraceae bacterium LMO-JJ14]
MEIVLVVAVSENRVIGRDGDLPWKISADLKHFKRVTMGHPVVMGRRTWESLPFPLPGRRNIVITRNPDVTFEGADKVGTIDGALDLCRDDGAEKAMIIGGGQIYAEIFDDADVIELTEVHAVIDGDTLFPEIDPEEWEETRRERHPAETPGGPAFSFVRLERRP